MGGGVVVVVVVVAVTIARVINAPFCVYGTDDPPYVWLPKELGAIIYLNRIVDCVETLQFNILHRSMKIDKHSILFLHLH